MTLNSIVTALLSPLSPQNKDLHLQISVHAEKIPAHLFLGIDLGTSQKENSARSLGRGKKGYLSSLAVELSAVEALMDEMNIEFEDARRQEWTLMDTTSKFSIAYACIPIVLRS